jgi:hypothetical protein
LLTGGGVPKALNGNYHRQLITTGDTDTNF